MYPPIRIAERLSDRGCRQLQIMKFNLAGQAMPPGGSSRFCEAIHPDGGQHGFMISRPLALEHERQMSDVRNGYQDILVTSTNPTENADRPTPGGPRQPSNQQLLQSRADRSVVGAASHDGHHADVNMMSIMLGVNLFTEIAGHFDTPRTARQWLVTRLRMSHAPRLGSAIPSLRFSV